jgi:hypothetical protein
VVWLLGCRTDAALAREVEAAERYLELLPPTRRGLAMLLCGCLRAELVRRTHDMVGAPAR